MKLCFSDVLVITSSYQQYNEVVLTSSLQFRFINNITTLLGRLLIDTVMIQRHDMVEQHRDVKATAIQSRYDVLYLLGIQN